MPGHALGSIGSRLTGSMTSRYQQAGSVVHSAGNRMSTIAGTERTNASNYRDVEADKRVPLPLDHVRRRASVQGPHVSTDPTPSPGGSTTPQSAPTLAGTGPGGRKVSFSSDQAQSIPLRDKNGNLIGGSSGSTAPRTAR